MPKQVKLKMRLPAPTAAAASIPLVKQSQSRQTSVGSELTPISSSEGSPIKTTPINNHVNNSTVTKPSKTKSKLKSNSSLPAPLTENKRLLNSAIKSEDTKPAKTQPSKRAVQPTGRRASERINKLKEQNPNERNTQATDTEKEDNTLLEKNVGKMKRSREQDECEDETPSHEHSPPPLSQMPSKIAKKPKLIADESEEAEEMEESSSNGGEEADCQASDGLGDPNCDEDMKDQDDETQSNQSYTEEEDTSVDPYLTMHPVVRQIFDRKLQHEVLWNFYLELARKPWISSMRPGKLMPYAGRLAREPQSGVLNPAKYGKVMAHLDTLEQTTVLRMMSFERHAQYINVTRCSPFVARTDRSLESAIICKSPALNLPAIFVALGVSQGSDLLFGSGDDNARSRKLHLQLLSQDIQYASAFICTLMRSNVVHCPIYGAALLLQSKKENFKVTTFSSTPSTEGMDSLADDKGKTMKTKKSKDNDQNIPPSPPYMLFADEIPVYDGRPDPSNGVEGFRPTPKGWAKLASMNRYFGEIPDKTIVAAGFTISGPWKMKMNPAHPTAHFNLMFAVLLTDPLPDTNAIADAEHGGGTNAEDNE
ncbi:hypothetical protein VNI00_006155 [Paramarasmius palmivorus]|uniref:Uncharacterized protein n=1 Tax=Paramarasmius palmivorus TaxID=297713 RepID=A0AAW0B1E0_9AGAR